MASTTRQIKCPNCGAEIDVNKAVFDQAEEASRAKYAEKLAEEKSKYDGKLIELQQERAALDKAKELQADSVDRAVKQGIEKEMARLQRKLKADLEEEHAQALKSLEDELAEKSDKLKEHNKVVADLARLKREKEELTATLEAEWEKTLSDTLTGERVKIQKAADQAAELKLAEKGQVIEQLKKQLQEAQRKAEQVSMQLQGEVQELAIEQWLRESFPLDTVEEIKKGALGADCLQIVNTRSRQACGKIYYESKRTKAFQPAWIEKFKADIREKGAGVGVLVTEAMPVGMERMGLKEGIWICTFEEFKGLSGVLRESVVRLSEALASQENKGEKMAMLYDYLAGNEFRMQVEAIVEGFRQLEIDLAQEKRAMERIWKTREKQIHKVLDSTGSMYGAIRGIAGAAVQPIALLELPGADEEAADSEQEP